MKFAVGILLTKKNFAKNIAKLMVTHTELNILTLVIKQWKEVLKMKFTVTWNVANQLKFKDFKSYESAKKFADKKAFINPTTCIVINDGITTKIERY